MLDKIEKYPAWSERYRPRTIDACILSKNLKRVFSDIVQAGVIPNLLLHGPSGTGKTTVASAMCAELGVIELFRNSSQDSGIDTLRTVVNNYCSTRSFDGSRKCVIFDEADYLNASSTQPALRAFMEEFASNVSFVFTCNTPSRIIDALHSRCTVIEFKLPNEEKSALAGQFFKRLKTILDEESITYDVAVLREIIVRHFPDFRRTINELQTYSAGGHIDSGILAQVRDIPYNALVEALVENDFTAMRKWIGVNSDVDSVKLMRRLYDSLYDIWDKKSAPDLVLALGEYSYRAAFAEDKELNLAACLTQVMMVGQAKNA